MSGHSGLALTLSASGIDRGTSTWTYDVRGNNNVQVGVAYMEPRQTFYGINLHNNACFKGGLIESREDEPSEFAVPCTVVMQLDAERGTLSFKINGFSLGVICRSIPAFRTLYLAVCTLDDHCGVTLRTNEVGASPTP